MSKKSELYKHVYFSNYFINRRGDRILSWMALIVHDHTRWCARFKTEREAALAVDKKLINMGKEPVNILKHK